MTVIETIAYTQATLKFPMLDHGSLETQGVFRGEAYCPYRLRYKIPVSLTPGS